MLLKQNIQCCPPPHHLRLVGNVVRAELAPYDPFPPTSTRRQRPAVAAGIRYERKVQEHLVTTYPSLYTPGPWIRYIDTTSRRRKPRFCQPDGFFVDFRRGLITVAEIKLKHTADAWWQLRRVYEPVLRQLFAPSLWDLAFLEIVRWYDPHTTFPQEHAMIADPSRMNAAQLGVHIWSGRR